VLLAIASARPWVQFRAVDSNNAVVHGTLRVQWDVVTDGPISSSPSFGNGMLFIGTNAGTLYAIDPKTGSVLWKKHVRNALMSNPLIYRGLVIVGEGNAGTPHPHGGPAHVGTGESALIAFDENTGAIRWRTLLRGSGMPTPAIVGGVLVHHDGSGRVTGMDPMTGRTSYVFNAQSIASMSAALPMSGGKFITSGTLPNAVLKIDAASGAVIWRSERFPQNALGVGDCPLAADGSSVFGEYVVPDGANVRQHAFALDAKTGSLLWDAPLESGPLAVNNEAGIPVVQDGVLYVGGAVAPWMHAIDSQTGDVIWRKRVYGPVKGAVAISKGIAYFGDLGGYLWALDARSGREIGRLSMPTGFNVGSPIIVGHSLIIGSFTGVVYAVPLSEIRAN
jgi:outer membrane protein assembly factor BamB